MYVASRPSASSSTKDLQATLQPSLGPLASIPASSSQNRERGSCLRLSTTSGGSPRWKRSCPLLRSAMTSLSFVVSGEQALGDVHKEKKVRTFCREVRRSRFSSSEKLCWQLSGEPRGDLISRQMCVGGDRRGSIKCRRNMGAVSPHLIVDGQIQ